MEKAELVFVPSPAIGHVVAAVEIAKLLTRRDDRISITVLVMQFQLDSGYSSQVQLLAASVTGLRISFVNLPAVEVSLTETTPAKFFSNLVQAHAPLVRDAVAQRRSSDSVRLAGLVIDMFCTPMIDVADEFGLPSYLFFTSSFAFLGFLLRLRSLHDDESVDVSELKGSDAELDVPSFVNSVPVRVLPSVLQDKESGGIDVTLFHVRRFREVKGFLVNSFMQLESHAINSFRMSASAPLPPVHPVGPILGTQIESGGAQQNDDVLINWLDDQPPLSVVFLCFGTRGSFDVDQVREIALALERGGHRFIWSLRKPPPKGKIDFPSDYINFDEVLPKRFLDETFKIGKVIGWAPQRVILAHPAIGGFVSHCGWNSILESIWYGVPIAVWPIYAEQQLNAFQIVRDLGLAAEIKLDYHDTDRNLVSAQEIERGIKCVMDGNSELREKVKDMKEKSREAVMDGGSSHSSLGCFMEEIMSYP